MFVAFNGCALSQGFVLVAFMSISGVVSSRRLHKMPGYSGSGIGPGADVQACSRAKDFFGCMDAGKDAAVRPQSATAVAKAAGSHGPAFDPLSSY